MNSADISKTLALLALLWIKLFGANESVSLGPIAKRQGPMDGFPLAEYRQDLHVCALR